MSWLLQDVWERIGATAAIDNDEDGRIWQAIFDREEDARACCRHVFDGGIFFNALVEEDVELEQDAEDKRVVRFHWKRS